MIKRLAFTVPWIALCSDNRKYVRGYILSKEYRESKALIGALSLAAAKKNGWQRSDTRLAMSVAVREPDRRRRDLNWSKCLKDGITQGEGLWWDDSQVRDERWYFIEHADKPDRQAAGADITIWEINDEERRESRHGDGEGTPPSDTGGSGSRSPAGAVHEGGVVDHASAKRSASRRRARETGQ